MMHVGDSLCHSGLSLQDSAAGLAKPSVHPAVIHLFYRLNILFILCIQIPVLRGQSECHVLTSDWMLRLGFIVSLIYFSISPPVVVV